MNPKKGWFASLFGRGNDGGKLHEGASPAVALRQSVGATSGDWHSGQTLLDDFVVERLLGEGGMGKVYLLKSRTTGTRFAVKRAKGLSEGERRNFLAELQTWIDLPEHANLVPCRFFRTVGDEVLIFAEYVEGGSLKDWIDSRTLYEGGAEKTLERILDTAIQFAWGLHCVHELGLVHQDVKPANVMMEKDAQVAVQGLKVRVTDYGLARARAAGGEQHVPELDQSILVSSGGYTPAYCSPEQADGRKLDRRTDVWSWGVSVLEMFQGEVTWQSGRVAAHALEGLLENIRGEEDTPAVPEDVAKLLEGCFREDPAQRWQSLEAVVQKLSGVYRAVVGTEYVRALREIEYRPTRHLEAGERWTREGASWRDPREWLECALQADGREPADAVEIVARHGSSRRGQLVADVAAYDEARRMFERLIKGGRKDLENDLAVLCQEAALVHETTDDSSGALALYDRAIEIRERLVAVEGRRELADDLARLYMNKASVIGYLGDNRAAVVLYDLAIEIRERLVNVEGRHELANGLATLYRNKALAVGNLGDERPTLVLYDRAIEIRKRLVDVEGRHDLNDGLADLYMVKAVAVGNLGDERTALVLYDCAIEIRERLVNVEGRHDLANALARLYLNKANAVAGLGDNRAAVSLYDRAIEILHRLVNIEGRRELAEDLATFYMNKANAVGALGDNRAAVGLYDQAIEIRERLINVEERRELASALARLCFNKANAVVRMGDNRAAVDLFDRAIEILDRLVNVEGRRELANDLASFYMNKANALGALGDESEAFRWHEKAAAQGRAESQFNLGILYERGRGVPKDERQAIRWYEKAAAQGNAEAQFNLGAMYEEGRGVPKDLQRAVLCYEQGAAHGFANAQFNLGLMCANGEGTPKNERKAVELFEQAAAQGLPDAEFNLGFMYANGRGICKNERRAAEWYEKAAARGYANAHFNLGWMYVMGEGVPKDDVQAYARFSVAVALGHSGAADNLALMNPLLPQSKKNEAKTIAKRLFEALKSHELK